MTSDRVTAVFGEKTKDIERLDATGKAKFSELDRSGVANQFSFTSADGIVRLRGSEPSAWDSKARVKANEIDWDTRNQRSYFRGKVSTTYYNQQKTGGATPFSDPDKPVYLTADDGEIDHRSQVAKYNGSARGWQDNNYVRADSFLIDQNKGTFFADGKVQSLLYNAARRENGKDVNVPAFASSQKLTYGRDSRILHYEGGVDIRQGTDRMTSRAVDIYLNEKNEMAQSIAQNDVVITQPKRKATGEYAQYIAADDTIVLRGNPATVTDAENGSSQGGEVKVYLRDNRVLGEGKSKQNTTGRVRSVYKVKGN
jgi:lipopolysaccharide export system protein LptA